ncbi:MAG: CHASE2 domain-containing protein, partial [bacterium]
MRARNLLIGIALAALVALMEHAGAFRRAELALYDFELRARNALVTSHSKPDGRIVIVAIDQKSAAALGRPPWRRAVYADALRLLRGADVVALDVQFSEPAEGDDVLADAVAAHGGVVLPFYEDEEGRVVAPVIALQRAAAGIGSIQFRRDADGRVRGVPLIFRVGDNYFFTFGLEVVRLIEGLELDEERTGLERLCFKPLCIPENEDGNMLISFAGGPGAFPVFSIADVLNGAVPPAVFEGKIVLVGTTDPAEQDYWDTPFSAALDEDIELDALEVITGGVAGTPGVEIHAGVANTILKRDFVRRFPGALYVPRRIRLGKVRFGGRMYTAALFAFGAAAAAAYVLLPPAWSALACAHHAARPPSGAFAHMTRIS